MIKRILNDKKREELKNKNTIKKNLIEKLLILGFTLEEIKILIS